MLFRSETSGVLLLAKRRSALTGMHAALREGRTEKQYLTLAKGHWHAAKRVADFPLRKFINAAGERRVNVDPEGQASVTIFRKLRAVGDCTLLSAELRTGRTHQIRVHLAHLGFPIAGDDKYGDFAWNRELARQGLKRMFLHAVQFGFDHPISGERVSIESPLPDSLSRFLEQPDAMAQTDAML